MSRPAIVAVAIMVAFPVFAQDAITTLPQNYTLQFQNEWVKVTRVNYPPHAKLAAHAHTTLASAYIYLNDSGPVAFRHVGGGNTVATRPATIAGAVRLFRGIDEVHEVENLSALPSQFLRVEFKTDPGDEPRSLRGKFMPERGESTVFRKVHFENVQIRLTRLFVPSGQTLDQDGTAPTLLVWTAGPDFGAVSWLPQQQKERLTNSGPAPIEALSFEFKTRPAAQSVGPDSCWLGPIRSATRC